MILPSPHMSILYGTITLFGSTDILDSLLILSGFIKMN